MNAEGVRMVPTTKLTVLLASAFAIVLRYGTFFASSVIVPLAVISCHVGIVCTESRQVGAVQPRQLFRHRLRGSRRIRTSASVALD